MQDLLLIPHPKRVEALDGICTGGFFCNQTFSDPMAQNAVDYISSKGKNEVCFLNTYDSGFAEFADDSEGYVLKISKSKAEIFASHSAGFLYGAITLTQLITQFGNEIPCMVIFDKPKIRLRGTQVSYAQVNVEYRENWLKNWIKKMAMLKINYITLYYEWNFKFPSMPNAVRDTYMSPEDVRRISAFAKKYNIVLIPGLNVLGHAGDFLAAEKYRDMMEYDKNADDKLNAIGSALCPSSKTTLLVVENILNDIMDCFDSDIIHVGGDEVSIIGKCPRCASEYEEVGAFGIYMRYFLWVRDILKKRNRKMGIWGDMLINYYNTVKASESSEQKEAFDNAMKTLRDNTVIFDWHYDSESAETLEMFKRYNFKVIASSSDNGCVYVSQNIMQINQIYALFKDCERFNIEGGMVCDWINYCGEQAEKNLLLIGIGNSILWQGADDKFAVGSTQKSLIKAISIQFYGIHSNALSDFWHFAGDGEGPLLSYFPAGKNGSYLRRVIYLTDNPFAAYVKYRMYLSGKTDEYRKAVETLEQLWGKVCSEAKDDGYLDIVGNAVVIYRHFYERFTKMEKAHLLYIEAARVQNVDNERFCRLLDEAAGVLRSHICDFDGVIHIAERMYDLLGVGTGEVLRLVNTQKNLEKIASFFESLKDNHRLLPVLSMVTKFLLGKPTFNFWGGRSDEWHKESPEFVSYETEAGGLFGGLAKPIKK